MLTKIFHVPFHLFICYLHLGYSIWFKFSRYHEAFDLLCKFSQHTTVPSSNFPELFQFYFPFLFLHYHSDKPLQSNGLIEDKHTNDSINKQSLHLIRYFLRYGVKFNTTVLGISLSVTRLLHASVPLESCPTMGTSLL